MLTTDQAAAILTSLGYPSLLAYQKTNGLPETGRLDAPTERHLLQIRYCQLPDFVQMDARQPLAKWPTTKLTWGFAISFQLPGFSRDDLVGVFEWVWKQWEQHTQLKFTYTQVPTNQTNIVISSGRIDNPGNTLAWSELPPSPQVKQKYDHHEPFVFSSNPPAGKIDLGAVGVHEGGHALGISHAPNSSKALMAPIYNPLIRTPQDWDIEQIQARYGKASPSQPPTPTTPDTPSPGSDTPDTPSPGPIPAKSPWKPGVDYTLENGYICIAVPDSCVAPQYRKPTPTPP